jgi:hypothetical protein
MPEAGYIPIPKKLARAGVKDMVRVSDGRMSGTAAGTIVLHVTPESAIGGPLAYVRNGDRIRLSVKQRAITLLVSDAAGRAIRAVNVATGAVLAGVLIVGVGIGTSLTSNTAGNQGNIASSQQLDMAVADPEFCKQWGASAFVQDVQMYTTMNPSSSFVTQPKLQPGCVIRRENWSVLQKEGAVTNDQMRQCKQRMNTFAYIGSIRDKPVVRCVYQTDIVDNKFQTKGTAGAADDSVGVTPEADQF